MSLYVGLSPSGGPVAGVALLPFVDERRLRAALGDVYPDLSTEEGKTNGRGGDSYRSTMAGGGLIPVDQRLWGTHTGGPIARSDRLMDQ